MASGRWLIALVVSVAACGGDDPEVGGTDALPGTTTGGPVGSTSAPGTTTDTPSTSTTGSEPGDASTTTGDAADESSTGGEPSPPYLPARYPAGRVHSPVSAFVADQWRAYADASGQVADDVFMKVGASSTVSPASLFCFETDDTTDLGDHEALGPALAYYRGGDAAGSNPFGRTTLAAQTGRSAQWVIDGAPSPLSEEWDAVSPRVALVHYGTNDMNLGITHGSAMIPFHEAMMALVDDLLARGTVPVLFGITRRADNPTAQLWVESYNAAIRGMAQSRQIPFVDLYAAIDPLPDNGLSGDGIHLHTFSGGACVLTEEGLQWGFNMRNRVALEGLDRTMAVLADEAERLDENVPTFVGDGTPADPIRIDDFPFAHSADTQEAPTEEIDAYPPCDDADESGPEVRYRLELDAPTPLRVLVLDDAEVDVDVHIIAADGDGDSCIARGDRRIEGEVPAGSWDIVVDTWGSGADVFAGEYLLVVLPCEPGDEACAGAL